MADKKPPEKKPTPPKKKPVPNHMDKSMTFGYTGTDGKKANDINKFQATSRYVPVAKNEEHLDKQLKIQADNNKKLEELKKKEEGKKWITPKGKEKEVAKQKEDAKKAYEKKKQEIIKKGQAEAKKTYLKSKDSTTKKFNDKTK